jgi:hypothetical protein
MRRRLSQRKEKGYAIDDPFFGYIKGYDQLEVATRNAMELSTEVRTTGVAGGLISPIRALLTAPLKGV